MTMRILSNLKLVSDQELMDWKNLFEVYTIFFSFHSSSTNTPIFIHPDFPI